MNPYLFSFVRFISDPPIYLLVYGKDEETAREIARQQCYYNSGVKALIEDITPLTIGAKNIAFNVTKPSDKSKDTELLQLISGLEALLSKEQIGKEYYHVLLNKEYPIDLCKRVEEIYKDAGWAKVCCSTSDTSNVNDIKYTYKFQYTDLQLWAGEKKS